MHDYVLDPDLPIFEKHGKETMHASWFAQLRKPRVGNNVTWFARILRGISRELFSLWSCFPKMNKNQTLFSIHNHSLLTIPKKLWPCHIFWTGENQGTLFPSQVHDGGQTRIHYFLACFLKVQEYSNKPFPRPFMNKNK
jgi:hypothetical protein